MKEQNCGDSRRRVTQPRARLPLDGCNVAIVDRVNTTMAVWMGTTINCCQCHNHKYDPITQEDYFRLRAFFEPIHVRQDRVPGEADPGPFQEYDYSTLRESTT